jgi:hypothetical protein
MRNDHDHSRIISAGFEARIASVVDRFFDVEHATVSRRASQKMLRPLKHEVPSQMGETDEITPEWWKREGAADRA